MPGPIQCSVKLKWDKVSILLLALLKVTCQILPNKYNDSDVDSKLATMLCFSLLFGC